MNKRKPIQVLTAMVLSVIIVVSMIPVPALAQNLESGEALTQSVAQPVVLMAEGDLLGNPAASFVLKGLASGALSAIGGRTMDEAMAQIFGKSSSEIDSLISAFQDLEEDIKEIKSQIDNLSAKINKATLQNDLRAYATFINGYAGVYEHLSESLSDYSDNPKLTSLFLAQLYSGADINFHVDGKSIIEATLTLGNYLCKPFSGNNYNTFGAFDMLDKFINRWEHQGYAQRQAFRDEALYTYALFCTMAQLACQTAIDNNSGNSDNDELERKKANQWLKQLKENATKVDEMNDRCAIKEHPGLRIYRDTKLGNDLYVFKTTVEVAEVYRAETWNKPLGVKEYLLPMARTTKFNREDSANSFTLYSQQPSKNMYQKLYDDYKTDNSGRAIDLYNIFFDEDKGDFIPPTSLVGIKANFATHAYTYSRFPTFPYDIVQWYTKVIGNDSSVVDLLLVIARADKTGTIIDVFSQTKDFFFSPIYYYGAVEQGKLMLPVDENVTEPANKISGMESYYELPYNDPVVLSVDAKTGYTYQWYVNTGDGNGYKEIAGATNLTYTLPTLSSEMNGYQYICAYAKDSSKDGLFRLTDITKVEPTTSIDTVSGDSIVVETSIHTVSGDSIAVETSIPSDETVEFTTPTETELVDDNIYTAPATLRLVGEGVHIPETEHEVGSPEDLAAALEQVNEGEWNGHSLRLTGDIEFLQPITLIDRSIVIDTNGHTLTVNPSATSHPNIDPMSSEPAIAAVYVSSNGALTLPAGGLNVKAGEGIAYGVYAVTESAAQVSSVAMESGGTCVYASNGGFVMVSGPISAEGNEAIGTKCADGGMIDIEGDVTVSGQLSCGAYIASSNGASSIIEIDGNITVSGSGSRCAYLDSDKAELTVKSSVTGDELGISVGQGKVAVQGNVVAPDYAINAWDGAIVSVQGNVFSEGTNAVAVSSSGAEINIKGNITSSGSGGTGISAMAWKLADSVLGAQVTVDGIINATTPLRIENLPIEESSYANPSSKLDYRTYTDGTSSVWDKYSWTNPSSGSSTPTGPTAPKDMSNQPVVPEVSVTVEVPVTAVAGINGIATTKISDQAITDAITKAQEDAKAQGKVGNDISIALNVTMPQGATSLSITLTQSTLNSLINAGVSQLEIRGTSVSLGFDLAALKEIQQRSSGDVSISFTPMTDLSKAAKSLLGKRPVYNFTISYMNKKGKIRNISNLRSGTAIFSIPYAPSKNEAVGYLFGVYVDDKGKATRILSSAYDTNSKSIIISTNHFSVYGVGYKSPSVKFTDNSTHWGKDSIDYVVGRGLLSGTLRTTFSPNTAMTRAMLVTALGRLAGIDEKTYTTSSFTDVTKDKYYAPYVEWAYKKGIVQSIGNQQFAPNQSITREEIAMIFVNFATATGYKLPVIREAIIYADASCIDSSYNTAVTSMQQAGIMMSGSDNMFHPKSSASRAEVSAMLHRYIKLTIAPVTAQGWAINDVGQYLYYKDGKPLTGWQTIDGVKYFFETTGVLKND